MSKAAKILMVVLLVIVAAFCVAFGASRYLANRLDGTGGVSAPQDHMLQYSSEEGYSFMYPDTYEISARTQGTPERQWDTLVLLPKGYVPPQNGEGPPAITLSVFANPEELPLAQWVQSDGRSNWSLIVDERASTSTTVGGEQALWYHYSGLYEVDSVAVAHGGKVLIFSGDWLDPADQIRADFNNLIKTVQFTDAH